MAQDGVGEHSRKVHPFFAKAPPDAPSATPDPPADHTPLPQLQGQKDASRVDTDESRRKRQKTDKSVFLEAPGSTAPKQGGQSVSATNDPILRRVQTAGSSKNEATTSAAPEVKNQTDTSTAPIEASPMPAVGDTKPPSSATGTLPVSNAPTKVLRFNTKTGTLGSPPKLKRSKETTQVVCMKYGQNETDRKRIGNKITQILDGRLQIPPETVQHPLPQVKTQKGKHASNTQKSTHPFFSGKPKPGAEAANPVKERNTVFLSSPISPRKQKNPFQQNKAPQFSIKSAGTKVPGAMHPLWPPRGFSHVRGVEPRSSPPACSFDERAAKKSKGQTVNINHTESVLAKITQRVDLEAIKHNLPENNDTFLPPPGELRLPKRHFESGKRLRRRIRKELHAGLPGGISAVDDSSEDELAQDRPKRSHPAVTAHWQSLSHSLSAYDRSTCESSSWTTKYAPASAEQVLQPGKEVVLLKQWLEQLRVQSVESANSDGSDKAKARSDGVKKKKRKNKLDDFVVDSEDENSELGELSDSSDVVGMPGHRTKKKSIVKTRDLNGKDPSRLANSLIISGPHGCGKTAAVYAVAKELGFEIFEINSSTRRSGKDILEKVGDMTRNHLVQQHRAEAASSDVDDTADDIKSGKQGMMTSFFQPKPATKSGPKPSRTSTQKAQKQSLILVEEADILYEDDKQFWATLVGMMSQSKRPFIMTCNDESLLPIQTLNLHGIFRFGPAPESLAVDLCLVVAANEGHALKRRAVEALFRSRGNDLRATLTDLNYWCQLGVGDRRGGHDWFYLRWPKGIDRDARGDTVRVISEDTYQPGMGWICRDPFAFSSNGLETEEEAAQQAWDYWGLDLADWQRSFDVAPWCKAVSNEAATRQRSCEILTAYDTYTASISDADVCASGAFAEDLTVLIDATQPEMPETAKEDFIIGRSLIEAEPLIQQFCSKKPISASIASIARNSLRTPPAATALPPKALQPVDESKMTAILNASFKYKPQQLTRYDVAVAFDPIAASPKAILSSHLDPSVFDRTTNLIVLEVAPWVRGIVDFESRLMQDRQKLSNLLNEGGKRKRMRTTRSAYSALEGGERRSTRRDRYFGDSLSTDAVMYTAGQGWRDCLPAPDRQEDVDDGVSSSPMSVGSGA
jgi:DNA polymerase III delta prime subunit